MLVYFEFNSNTVVEPSNLELLNIPILATLPRVKKNDKGYHLSQMFLEDVNSEFSESIRTLRTLMVAKFHKKKSLLISLNLFRGRKNYYCTKYCFSIF